MAFTSLGTSKKLLYAATLARSINSKSIDWAFIAADRDKILGTVVNNAFGLGCSDMEPLQTMAAVIANETAMAAVAASSTAMTSIAASSTAMAAVAASSTACAAIKASSTAIIALDNSSPITIPTMTSNTVPSGTASASSSFSDTYAAWKAMDKSNTTHWITEMSVITNSWLQYAFPSPVWCYKITIITGNNEEALPKNFKIQYSSDNTTFYDAITNITQSPTLNVQQTFNVCTASGKKAYWRIYVVDNWGYPDHIDISEINFYCK